MKRRWSQLVLILFFTVALTVGILLLFNQNVSAPEDVEPVDEEINYGISGFNPANFPDSTKKEIKTFWEEVNDYSRIYGVHINWNDLSVLNLASEFYNHEISLVLGFQDPNEWVNDADDFFAQVDLILKEHPKVKYLFIGNEINLLYLEHESEFSNFVSAYEKVYEHVSTKYPDVKVGTVFQYDVLRNTAKLMPNVTEDQFELLNQFQGKLEVVGLTVYPFFNYSTPLEIPENYFVDLQGYLDASVALTETGWMSRASFGEEFKYLEEDGTTGSEMEQVQFLNYLQGVMEDARYNVEFINWAFLNDIADWEDGVNSSLDLSLIVFDSIGLKRHIGDSKLIWKEWKRIFSQFN